MMTASPAPPATSPTAMNWLEPAKTNADSPAAAHGVSPELTANAPKMMAKGNAPTASGMVALAPAQNSEYGVDRSVGDWVSWVAVDTECLFGSGLVKLDDWRGEMIGFEWLMVNGEWLTVNG